MLNTLHSSHHILVSNELKINVREYGSGEPTCILLHGTADGAYVWEDLVQEIAGHCRVLSIDLRGHGESDWHPTGKYEVEDYVADIESVLGHFSLERCVLVGHSLGAQIGLHIGSRHLEKVARIVLVDWSPEPDMEVVRYLQEQLLDSYKTYDSPAQYVAWLAERRLLPSTATLERIAQDGLAIGADGKYWLKFDIRVAQKWPLETATSESWQILTNISSRRL